VCDTGFYNDGNNVCVACGTGCESCEAITGNCLSCMYYFLQNPTDPQICDAQTKCPYPVGPVEAAPAKCFDTAYSSTRVVPPFVSIKTDIDWRTQGVVRSIQNQG
jgi:hypothetical protein